VTPGRRSAETTLVAAAETLVGLPRRRAAPPPPAPARPSAIGRYEVRGLLGEGAMACVYRALDPIEGREVAVKTLKEPFASDPRTLDRFRREAEIVSRLAHPRLVAVLDVGETWFVQELVEGECLASRLRHEPRLSPAEIVATLGAIADALDHIHAHGVVHRDLKPANVILTASAGVRLADFGVAHVVGTSLTPPDQVIGSPAYMAPEQITRSEVDARSDLYALAVVAYEMLAGKRPFRGRGIGRLLESIVRDEPPRATELSPWLPPAVDAVLAAALAKNPDRRPPSADAFVRALVVALSPLLLP
jgi:eukaryotic-like serine/threonine-protein kinase